MNSLKYKIFFLIIIFIVSIFLALILKIFFSSTNINKVKGNRRISIDERLQKIEKDIRLIKNNIGLKNYNDNSDPDIENFAQILPQTLIKYNSAIEIFDGQVLISVFDKSYYSYVDIILTMPDNIIKFNEMKVATRKTFNYLNNKYYLSLISMGSYKAKISITKVINN